MTINKLLNLKIYIINMLDKEDNYIRCKNELIKYGFKNININRFISFDSTDSNLLCEKSCQLNLTNFFGTNTQQSATLAHLSIFNDLINSDEDEFLIFEDDIIFHTDFNKVIEFKIKDINNFDILFLGSWVVGNKFSTSDINFVTREKGIEILLAHAYIITKKAAKLILEKCSRVGYQVIDQIFCNTMKGELDQVALIHSPYLSNNYTEFVTKEEEYTGLIYQTKHISTVINNNLKHKNWKCKNNEF